MSNFKPKTFLALYLIAALIESVGDIFSVPSAVHYVSKPALLILLIIYFLAHTQPHFYRRKHLVVALVFALLGDIFLLFQEKNPLFFMLGLGSFLLMQIGYSWYFNKERSIPLSQSFLATKPYYGLGILVMGLLIFRSLYPHLSDLFIPVLVYMLCIILMVLSAINRLQGSISKQSYRWVLYGALFFMLSDSILAINKFATPLPQAGFLIMATYAAAQYLIVLGVMKRE